MALNDHDLEVIYMLLTNYIAELRKQPHSEAFHDIIKKEIKDCHEIRFKIHNAMYKEEYD
jgi:hypothetical protein